MLKENLVFNKSFLGRQVRCSGCRYWGHMIRGCPFVHFIPNVKSIVSSLNVYEFLNRKKQFRNDRLRLNTRLNKQTINILGILFRVDKHINQESDLTNEVMTKL